MKSQAGTNRSVCERTFSSSFDDCSLKYLGRDPFWVQERLKKTWMKTECKWLLSGKGAPTFGTTASGIMTLSIATNQHQAFHCIEWLIAGTSILVANVRYVIAGNSNGGSITVLLTSCLTSLESAAWQLSIFVLFAKQTNPNQSNRRSMVQWYFPPLVFPG